MLGLFSSQKKQNEFEAQQAEMNRSFQAQQAEVQRMFQREMQKSQNEWNEQQTDKANEYNSAYQQVQRLLAAGLNPAMALGQSTPATPATSSPMSGGSVPSGSKANASNQPSEISQLGQFLGQIAQVENARADIAEARQRTKASQSMLPFQIGAIEAQVNKSISEKNRIDQLLPFEQYESMQRAFDLSQSGVNRGTQRKVMESDIETASANRSLIRSQIGRIETLKVGEFKKLLADAYAATQAGNWTKFQHEFAKKYGVTVQNNDWLNRVITAAMENPENAKTYFENVLKTLSLIRDTDVVRDALGKSESFLNSLTKPVEDWYYRTFEPEFWKNVHKSNKSFNIGGLQHHFDKKYHDDMMKLRQKIYHTPY